MTDSIEKTRHGSVIQHGLHNKRIYLIKLDARDMDIMSQLNKMARENGYTKIFCKVPSWAVPAFSADGFIQEAYIPGFYNGITGVSFMSKFLDSDRLLGMETEQLKAFSNLLMEYTNGGAGQNAAGDTAPVTLLSAEDAEEIAGVYKMVFKSYPFPVFDPAYISRTMAANIRYYGVKENGKLIALSSAEMDAAGQNVEMTDFATLPEARGKRLSLRLLDAMEGDMREAGMLTLYTIARLNSFPMNKTFLGRGYSYSGTLINNTNIAGSIESMNVLYKQLK
jgi:beta-lysine N6-acetyltransferase